MKNEKKVKVELKLIILIMSKIRKIEEIINNLIDEKLEDIIKKKWSRSKSKCKYWYIGRQKYLYKSR